MSTRSSRVWCSGHPSYLSSRAFAIAIMDLVAPASQAPRTLDDLTTGVKELPDGDVKKALVALVGSAQDRLDTAQKNIETWFDDSMGRVSGGYKRWAQKWTIGLAVSGLACEPCWTDARLHACAGRVECLARLSVDTVEAQVRRLRFILRSY